MKIVTEAVEEFIAVKARMGASSRAISASLLAELGVTLSYKGVAREMLKRRSERADVAKVVVREALGKSLNADLERLESIRASVQKRTASLDPDDTAGFAKLSDLEVKVIDRKLHYSGADTPDDSLTSLAEAEDRIRSRLDRLATSNGEGSGS